MLIQIIYILISLSILVFIGRIVIDSLSNISKYLGLKEFVVAFFTVSIGAVAPEFFVGISSALKGIPEVSLGNVVGQNLFLLTMTIALCTFFTSKGLRVDSKTVQAGITFATLASVLPLFLILDGELSRIDGILLLSCFALFVYWLFSKEDRFIKVYEEEEKDKITKKDAINKFIIAVLGVVAIVAGIELLLNTLLDISHTFAIPLTTLGIFMIALGTALPETYFAINLSRRGEYWMVLGGVMGGIAISSTFVLGVVSLIEPIVITDISSLVLARIFLTIAAILIIIFVTTGHTITKKEGVALTAVYISFLLAEILLI